MNGKHLAARSLPHGRRNRLAVSVARARFAVVAAGDVTQALEQDCRYCPWPVLVHDAQTGGQPGHDLVSADLRVPTVTQPNLECIDVLGRELLGTQDCRVPVVEKSPEAANRGHVAVCRGAGASRPADLANTPEHPHEWPEQVQPREIGQVGAEVFAVAQMHLEPPIDGGGSQLDVGV
jgi:hypothetical protein